jgi:hypothetical protein
MLFHEARRILFQRQDQCHTKTAKGLIEFWNHLLGTTGEPVALQMQLDHQSTQGANACR